ncbi:hypothetical protein HOI26_01235 [Candidatus Woesearchaeota archaeon]|nr:hypothetical protein [Candidatus Woesearchaeota archaeon]MBT5739698.1 hypothetical protein [Candidatus Woesearchaeota archaeon]
MIELLHLNCKKGGVSLTQIVVIVLLLLLFGLIIFIAISRIQGVVG